MKFGIKKAIIIFLGFVVFVAYIVLFSARNVTPFQDQHHSYNLIRISIDENYNAVFMEEAYTRDQWKEKFRNNNFKKTHENSVFTVPNTYTAEMIWQLLLDLFDCGFSKLSFEILNEDGMIESRVELASIDSELYNGFHWVTIQNRLKADALSDGETIKILVEDVYAHGRAKEFLIRKIFFDGFIHDRAIEQLKPDDIVLLECSGDVNVIKLASIVNAVTHSTNRPPLLSIKEVNGTGQPRLRSAH